MKTITTETEAENRKVAQERLTAYVKGLEKLKNNDGRKGEKDA